MSTSVIPVVDAGLGNSAHLVDLGDGRGLRGGREPRPASPAVRRRSSRPPDRLRADTHLHADFLSGALPLRADEGATVVASREGDREFPHWGLADGDAVDLGDLTNGPVTKDQHGPAVVMCGHGARATGAASLLARAGEQDPSVLIGGPEDWAAATGRRLEVGS